MNFAIRTEGLTKRFGELVAIDAVSIEVAQGCLYGLVGPNGAGKSTMVNMLTGLLGPTSGRMEILDRVFDRDDIELRRRLGVMPDVLGLSELLTGEEFLQFVASMYGLDPDLSRARTEELLIFLDLREAGSTGIGNYSAGMKKKLSFASAVIHDPDLLFLDEPFAGLDPQMVVVVAGALRRITERGSTVLLTSHMLAFVEKLCTHVSVIHRGEIVFTSPTAEIRARAESLLNQYGGLEEAFLSITEESARRPELSWLR
jgi:ABC-2 type transport system ATP-binding protein